MCFASHIDRINPVLSVNWINFKGTLYKPGMVLLVSANESGPVFGVLRAILSHDDSILLIFNYMLNLGFNEHVHGYAVESTDKWSSTVFDDLFDPFPLYAHSNFQGEKFVLLKYHL